MRSLPLVLSVGLLGFAVTLVHGQQALVPPPFNTHAYCEQVGNGSYEIELTCRQEEDAAEDSIWQWGKTYDSGGYQVGARILQYCSRVAGSNDSTEVEPVGSYSILYTCIKDEEEARRQLGH